MIESIGHYTILGLIGSGGRGDIYRARDTQVGRTVAVRVLGPPPVGSSARERFFTEIGALSRISHPHLAALFESGMIDGQVFVVFEFVPGEKLATLLSGRPLNPRRAVDLATQIASALTEAHEAGVVHRELTPGNVIVTPKGHAKIVDFGLSAWQPAIESGGTIVRLAYRGATLGAGAYGYMSPEQVLGQGADARSDVFALGAILFEMLTGRPAFQAANETDAGVAVLQTTPPAPSSLNPDAPAELDPIVAKALSKSLDDRYQSAAEMAEDLRLVSTSLHTAQRTIEGPEPARRVSSRLPRLGLVALLMVVGAAAIGWTYREDLRVMWRSRFTPPPAPIVVVTPFQVEGDQARPYFGAGLAEDLAMRLGQVRGLSVVGRPSLRALQGRDAVSIARQMNAGMVVTGAITPQGEEWNALRVEVSLVDGRDGSRLWSAQYDSSPRDALALEVRIANDLAKAMRIPDEPRPALDRTALRLIDPFAYDLYLQARHAAATGDSSRAAELFSNALERDGGAIEAQAGLAAALYTSAATDQRATLADVEPRLRQAAEEAATSDPDLPAARLAMGLAAPTLGEALAQLHAAIDLDPSSAASFSEIGSAILEIDPARALQCFLHAQTLDPTQARIHLQLAGAHLVLGQSEPAQLEVARGQALAPDSPWWYGMRTRIALGMPRRDVLAQLAARTDTEYAAGWYARVLALLAIGQPREAATSLAGLAQTYPGFCEARATLAGLRRDAGEEVEARRMAEVIYQAADAPGGARFYGRCAAMAAAALSDAEKAARWIDRTARDQAMLHRWTTTSAILSAQAGIRQRLYPWSNVLGHPQVNRALVALDRAIARARAEVARRLEGLLDPPRPVPARK